jgi:chromosome segregation ATPase
MTTWFDIGIGVVIGLLLGTLVAGLSLQALLKRRNRPLPELLKQRAELEAQLQSARAETERLRTETEQVRTELTQTRKTSDEHRLARTTLANEQTSTKMQLATIQGMLNSASAEKERLLIEVVTLRSELESLRTTSEPVETNITGEA